MLKKIIRFITLLAVIGFNFINVNAESPTTDTATSYPTPEYNETNLAMAPRGTEGITANGIAVSLGNGLYKILQSGNVFDGSGNYQYTIANNRVLEGELSFGTHGDDSFNRFLGISVDKLFVDQKNYAAREGSVIITLGQDFIDGLEVGKHTLTCHYSSKPDETIEFTIVRNDNAVTVVKGTDKINTFSKNDISRFIFSDVIIVIILTGILFSKKSN